MEDLGGKVAVVTGSASGIGRALAERFASEAMKVVLADVEVDPLEEVAEKLRGAGTEVLAVPTDVSMPESVEELAGRTFEHFGAAHVVCNNAGVGTGGLSWELPLSTWEWVLGVNLWGVIHGIRAFVPRLVAQGEGHVVNTASVAGLLSAPGMAAYCASKHAVVGISESLLHELSLTGANVGVSVLCPGFISTRIVDAERNWPERLGPRPEMPSPPGGEQLREMMRQQIAQGMPPAEVAEAVLAGVRAGRFWILTHPEFGDRATARLRDATEGRNPELNAFL